MTREEFIEYLKTTGLEYYDASSDFKVEYDGLYIFGCESKLKRKHPRKYKNLYVRYIRVSGFDSNEWYVRDNGITYYACEKKVMELIEDLKKAG